MEVGLGSDLGSERAVRHTLLSFLTRLLKDKEAGIYTPSPGSSWKQKLLQKCEHWSQWC